MSKTFTAYDIQKRKLEKLMDNIDKPVPIPERRDERKFPDAPEFVRNIMGSSAGAGSGEFHVYRHLRRKEYARQKYIKDQGRREDADREFEERVEAKRRQAEEKTAKKRMKRLKKKSKQKQRVQKSSINLTAKNDSDEEEDDDDEGEDGEEKKEETPKEVAASFDEQEAETGPPSEATQDRGSSE